MKRTHKLQMYLTEPAVDICTVCKEECRSHPKSTEEKISKCQKCGRGIDGAPLCWQCIPQREECEEGCENEDKVGFCHKCYETHHGVKREEWEVEFEERYCNFEISERISIDDMRNIKSFITHLLAREREKLREEIEKKIRIHKKIIATHDICPKSWHEGNIRALDDVLHLLINPL